jgi:prolipoprotein diacylglyceryltransferase
MILTIVLLLTVIIFLFNFYHYARDDYFFIRKSVTMEQLFNVLFIGLFWGIITSRLFYVLLHFNKKFLNPLVFFLITTHPGLSVIGWIIGIFLAYIFLAKRRKIHVGRFLDYVAIAALSALPLWYLGVVAMNPRRNIIQPIGLFVTYSILYFIFTKILFPKFMRGKLKEGSISLLFLLFFSIVSFVNNGIVMIQRHTMFAIEDILFIALFFISLILFVRLETHKRSK